MEAMVEKQSHYVLTAIFVLMALYAINFSPDSPARYPIPEVDLRQAQKLIAEGARVIDVRGQPQFDSRHIPGAILLTLETLRAGIPKSFDLTKTSNIVVYCGKGNMHGPEATRILRQAGYTNAVNLAAGIQGWADAGLAIDKV